MSCIRKFIGRYTLPFVILFAAAAVPISRGVSHLLDLFPTCSLTPLIEELVHMAVPMGIVLLLGFGFSFSGKGFVKTARVGVGVFLYYLLAGTIHSIDILAEAGATLKPIDGILLGVVAMIGVGVREEMLFRGVVVNALALRYGRSAKGLWGTVLLSGLLFGFVHMFNMLSGVSLGSALVQSLGAAGIGFFFVAVYLRGGNIWFLILLHALVDSVALFRSTFVQAGNLSNADQINDIPSWAPIVVLPVFLLISAYLLRKKKQPEIFERLQGLRDRLDG
jgi:membrane protease YdiL (CAAX protease family)